MRFLAAFLGPFLLAAAPDEPPPVPTPTATPLALVGSPAPEFTLRDLDGNWVALKKLREEPGVRLAVVCFVASWCPPCKDELPVLRDLQQRHRASGLRVLVVSIDKGQLDTEILRGLSKKYRLDYPIVTDRFQIVSRRFLGEKADIPTAVLVDSAGTILRIRRGSHRIERWLEDDVALALGLPAPSQEGSAKLWQYRERHDPPAVPTGEPVLTMQSAIPRGVERISVDAGSSRILLGGSRAMLWDLDAGRLLRTIGTNAKDAVFAGGRVAVANSSALTIFDPHDGHAIADWIAPAPIEALAASPDGRIAAGLRNGTVGLLDGTTGRVLQELPGPARGDIGALALSPTGDRLAIAAGPAIRLWSWATDATTRRADRVLELHGDDVVALAFSPDGSTLASSDRRGGVRLWSAHGELLASEHHGGLIASLSFSPHGTLLAAGTRGERLHLLDPDRATIVHDVTVPGATATTVAYLADGRLLASDGSSVLVLDSAGAPVPGGLVPASVPALELAATADGRFLLVGGAPESSRRVIAWDLESARPVGSLTTSTAWTRLAFSRNGRTIVNQEDLKSIRVRECDPGLACHATPRDWEAHPLSFDSLAVSDDGRVIASGGREGIARIWSAKGDPIATLTGHTLAVSAIAISPDAALIATGSWDETVALWNAQTGARLALFTGHGDEVKAVAFSADGRLLASASRNGEVRLWNVAEKTLRSSLPWSAGGLVGRVNGWDAVLAFSPDGRTLAAAHGTGARLWSVETRGKFLDLEGHGAGVQSVTFIGNDRLATASDDGTTRIWRLEPREWIALATFKDGGWAVVDDRGRFDASNGGDVSGMHWVVGAEPLALSQLKERYYDPGLLAKRMGRSEDPLLDVRGFNAVKLFPAVELDESGDRLRVKLRNRGGGIGRVQVFVNGKELTADARGPAIRPDAADAELAVDLSSVPRLASGASEVRVVAWTADGHLSSRGAIALVSPRTKAPVVPPEVHAIVIGVSRYAASSMDLRFSSKDAEDFATAVELGAGKLFGAARVHVRLLSSNGTAPSRDAIERAFEEARRARPEDVLVVYLAGHGISLDGEYLYLTADARSMDAGALADPAVRKRSTVSSEEFTQWIKKIPALKQVMVLDTCAAGAAEVKLLEQRAVSSDQVRAIERLKDRTGFHVLMGSAADAVSYEASRYGQGLLTYSLLEGMRGAALRDGEFVDVSKLFQYAADRVRELATDIGGVQKPLVAAPSGTSFDIGQLGATEREKVPLAAVKPVVLRPQLGNDRNFDALGLSAKVRVRLRGQGAVARGGRHVFVDVGADEFPGGIAPVGRYTVTGESVKVELWLYRAGAEIASSTVEGKTTSLDALADSIAAAIEAAMAK